MQQKALWETLRDYHIGGQQAELFCQKLKHETGWSAKMCLSAILEYKRFLYLTAVSPSPVTPSKSIDAVWHLHLTFSRCYWGLCENILHNPLHHDPSDDTQSDRMAEQYKATLALYEQEFSLTPDPILWPTDHIKPSRNKHLLTVLALTSTFGASMAYAVDSERISPPSTWSFWDIFWIIFIVVVVFNLLKAVFSGNKGGRRGNGSNDGSGGGGGCGSGDGGGGGGCGGGGD